MLMKRGGDSGNWPGNSSRLPHSGQGFLNAPWWRLLLWIAVFLAIVVLAEVLGFA